MTTPLVVNTLDGTVWMRRAVTRDGLALYAVDGVCRCPEYVMATLPELAEHGIAGSADVLPVPVGTEAAVAESADKLTRLLAPTQALREEPHDGPLHHDYRLGRDLPETGGVR